MSRRRTLKPDEEQLWQDVARTIRPLSEAALARLRKAKPLPVMEAKPIMGQVDPIPAPKPHFTAFRLGEKARPLRSAAHIASISGSFNMLIMRLARSSLLLAHGQPSNGGLIKSSGQSAVKPAFSKVEIPRSIAPALTA